MASTIKSIKTQVAKAIIHSLTSGGNKEYDIQTPLISNYVEPAKIMLKGKKNGYTPDIKASNNEHVRIYDIEPKGVPNISRWRIFSTYVDIKKGEFYVAVPTNKVDKVKDFLLEGGISANIIHFA